MTVKLVPRDESYRKPQGRAPEEPAPEPTEPTPEEIFHAAILREMATPIVHEGISYRLTHLGVTGSSTEEDEEKYPSLCHHLFEVHATRSASWWWPWAAELYQELAHGSLRDWRTADGKNARTPDDVFVVMLERRKLLRTFEARRKRNR